MILKETFTLDNLKNMAAPKQFCEQWSKIHSEHGANLIQLPEFLFEVFVASH